MIEQPTNTEDVNKTDQHVDPIIALYMRDVDVSLIQRNLRLTPQERIDNLMVLQRFAKELQQAGQKARETA